MSDDPNLNGPVTHVIPHDDAAAWLEAHGFDINGVRRVTIEIGRPVVRVSDVSAICAWVDVEWYRTTPKGGRYFGIDEEAEVGTSTVPLKSWPPLVDAAGPTTAKTPSANTVGDNPDPGA